MTQVVVGTIINLSWEHDGRRIVRQPDGQQLSIAPEEFAKNFLPLGHIDHYPPHEQRLIGEHAVLADRVEKLEQFLQTEFFQTLAAEEQDDMHAQLNHMVAYRNVLARRIDRSADKRAERLAQASVQS